MGSDKTVYVVLGGTSGIGAELAKQLESDHTIVHVASRQTGLDISDEKSVYHYFETIGAFDHLIVTAGSYAPAGKVVDVEITQAKYAFDTKFWGAVLAAIEATTKVLAKELAPIRVNAISPGLTKTEAYKGMNADDRDAMYQRTQSHLPVGKVGEASDIAMAYLFAIQNSYMTGTVIDVDGGALLG
ncbi:TPA: SDR family oxidoreductase [Vibrio vulnificus]|nr:SDR family oxidoreductase [Vibrio vulnificus]HDY7622706.1 SDR family oxidoreductase [Vibrio vulnificus]HEB2780094.1 SDR family oxidoreductase [Vibrio vulnificus]